MNPTMTRLQTAAMALGIVALAAMGLMASAANGQEAMGRPDAPGLEAAQADGAATGGAIDAADWDALPLRSPADIAQIPLDYITMDEVALGVRAMLPESDYWLFAQGGIVSPQAPGLVRLLGGMGDEAAAGETMEAGLYANLTSQDIAVRVDGDTVVIRPGDALAIGVEDATFHGEVGVDCDENHFACCSSKGFSDGKYAVCRSLGKGDEDCETGGHGSTGCTIVPTRKRIGV